MSTLQPGVGVGAQKQAEVATAVRGLCTVLNTALVYAITHPVFQRAVEQEVAALETALKGIGELPVFFAEGQIRFGTLPLDPASAMLQKTAQTFESKGIKGLIITPGITAEEITKFVGIITARNSDLQTLGLSALLDRQGVRHLREQKVRLGIVGKDGVVRPKDEAPKPPKPSSISSTRAASWDIEIGTDDLSMDNAFKDMEPPAPSEPHQKPIRNFVSNVLSSVQRRETDLSDATEMIAQEFEHRLNEKTEEVQKASEMKIKRLERVNEVMLQELEDLHVAAVVLDAELFILGANPSGRKLVGNIGQLEIGSPLAEFAASKKERDTIEINGLSRLAHIILSTARDKGEGTMLICLE